MVPIYQDTLGWHGSKETVLKCLTIPLKPFQTPQSDPLWTNTGMGSNLPVNGTVECDAYLTVGYCCSCARSEGSYPCS